MASQPAQFEYSFCDGSDSARVQFNLNTNKPYLQVRANSTGPYWFLLDTGSISMVLDTELAEKLALSGGETFEASGAGEGSITASVGGGVALAVGNLEVSTGPVDILPINRAISFSEGLRVDGLLGRDLFANLVVEIDYAGQVITFHERRQFTYKGKGVVLPLQMVRGHPFVDAELVSSRGDSIAGSFLIDTGWRSALSLNAPFVRAHSLLDTSRTIQAVTGVGVGGASTEAVGRVKILRLGSLAIEDPVTNFSSAKAGILSQSDMAGIIGGEVLRRFTVVFDYSRNQMILEPNVHFAETYEFDMAGLMPVAEGANLDVFRVYHVIDGSPAQEAGVRAGDVISAIDGRTSADLSLEQVRRLFKQGEGKEYRVSLVRGEEDVEVALRLRRLI